MNNPENFIERKRQYEIASTLNRGDRILINEKYKNIASAICNRLTKKIEGSLFARLEINNKYYIKRIK